MARPFRNEFETDQSPMSPLSPGSGTPTSYRANVNRQKTKKWVDAKTVDYGGDDWGEDDDYYDPPPPPISKSTGTRQQAQAITSPGANNDRKGYGDLSQVPDARGRSNSFDADDEKRNFSSSSMPQQSIPNPAPATRFSQMSPGGELSSRVASGPPALHITTQQSPPNRLQDTTQFVSPQSESSRAPIQVSTESSSKSLVSPISDSRSSPVDYQTRRDFSPASVPPLVPRASPAPQSTTNSPNTKFPPRKSSISQHTAPNTTGSARARQESPGPWTSGRSASPGGASAKSKSSTAPVGKALPFIRPADIYKRMEEERERERQSMESGRPSLDSVLGSAKASERSDSPGKPHIRERASSDSLGVGKRNGSLDFDEASDSNRRMLPILAPVQERKSEYGFEGYEAPQEAARPYTEIPEPFSSERQSSESTIVPSTSPKLPDLNRMSGFGMDLFSESIPHDSMVSAEQGETAATGASDPTDTDIPDLRTQPSLGFRSVVNQAFDRTERSAESSVPATPASRSGSGVRRTDSESTGTAGISPIMSRVPSAANPDSRNRDASTLQVVNEAFPEQGKNEQEDRRAPIPSAFKPGHRRDVSTPSPGNSPAHTPEFTRHDSIPQAEQALLSRAPDSVPQASLPVLDESTQQSRPTADREQSFRPQLPGGWTSFATTNTGNMAPESEPTQADGPEVSPIREAHEENNEDITPTTAKHPLPQLEVGTAIATSAAAAHEVNNESETPPTRAPHTYDSMPTPDPAMAPSGRVYSATALDSRLLPKLQSLSPEAQLRPLVPDRAVSADSSAAPTPPPKDTPLPQIIADDGSGYFPEPTVPLKQRSPDDIVNDEDFQPLTRPQMLPTLSTDTRAQDEESDKLRKEIIKSLSSRTSNAYPYHDSADLLETPTSAEAARESTYLPDSIYDNYWGDQGEKESPQLSRPATGHSGLERTVLLRPLSSKGGDSIMDDASIPPTPPLNTRKSQLIEAESQPGLSNRFSWERSRENVMQALEDAPKENAPQDAERVFETVETSERSIGDMDRNSGPPSKVHNNASAHAEDHGVENVLDRSESPGEHQGRDAPLVAGDKALAGSGGAAAAHSQDPLRSSPQPQPSRTPSIAEEKNSRDSSLPVSPVPPEREHPSKPLQVFSTDETEQPIAYTGTSSMTATSQAILHEQASSSTTKLLTFKEIVAMQDPTQRINTFDDHRHRFAAMDSGLSNWLSNLQAENPAYSDESSLWGSSTGNVNPSRSRFRRGSTAASPLQPPQPYYQQYLNASSPTTPTTPTSRPGTNLPTGSQQGFTSGGSKITSQQVQAKGKELLHTAGIFSGKAGKGAAKAGKGLLAKGKSRFRGSGVGDKTEASSKPKNERRSSWGLPLALSRSVNQPDSSSREARQATSLQPFESRPINVSTISDAANESVGPISDEVSNLGDTAQQAPKLPTLPGLSGRPESTSLISEINRPVSRELQDDIAAPVPISKEQPSWDPHDANPIHEEDAFQITAPKPTQLGSAPVQEGSSERSNSGDAHFYDANEQHSPDEDWVMVQQESKPKEKKRPQSSKVAEQPTSILHRTRGSFDVTKSSPFIPVSPVLSQSGGGEYETQSKFFSKKDDIPVQIPITVSTSPQQSTLAPVIKQAEHDEVIPRDPTFKGLPPIRRTSAFGFGFGSRQTKARFPIDDDDEDAPSQAYQGQHVDSYPVPSATGISHFPKLPTSAGHTVTSFTEDPANQLLAQNHSSVVRPEPVQASSLVYSQQTTTQQQTPESAQSFPRGEAIATVNQRVSEKVHAPGIVQDPRLPPSAHQGSRISQEARQSQEAQRSPEAHRSQEAWRPNAGMPPSNQRQYVDPQPVRSAGQNYPKRSESLPRATPNPLQKGFDQPPSSAFRYPQLFQAGSQGDLDMPRDIGEMPSGYYQQPIHRDEAFLPRQQTSEYQLPGVGPPTEEARVTTSRRNSLFGNLGGKLSRNASRDRTGSTSRDADRIRLESRDNGSDQVAGSEDSQVKHHRRRSSLFGNLNRASTSGSGLPQSHESTVAQASGFRTDLLNMNKEPPRLSPAERKRSFFGSSTSSQPFKSKPNQLSRASTSAVLDEGSGKKKRFSTLSKMFGSRERRSSKAPTARAVQIEGAALARQSPTTAGPRDQDFQGLKNEALAEPLQTNAEKSAGLHNPMPASGQSRAPIRSQSQQRHILTKKLSLPDSLKSRQDSRSRRPSGSGFFGGLMGRKSQQEDRSLIDTNRQAKPLSPQQTVPNISRASQGLQQFLPQSIPLQDTTLSNQEHDRGRRASREPEPEHDNVPILGDKSFTHGAEAHQSAQHDPHYTHQKPDDVRMMQQDKNNASASHPQSQTQGYKQQTAARIPQFDGVQDGRDHRYQPNGPSSLETYEDYQRRQAPRRLSSEDILARSPAREPVGQQRPYRISLPGEEEEISSRMQLVGKNLARSLSPEIQQINTSGQALRNRVSELQQPVLRHPESPAGYPLPSDTAFSPVIPSAQDYPPPPLPKWDHLHTPSIQDLGRSNTGKTHASEVSQESAEATRSLIPQKKSDLGSGSSPSITPERRESPQSAIRPITLDAPARSEEGQYDATPKVKNGDLGYEGKEVASSVPRGWEQEEKIFLSGENIPVEREHEGATMSATSYPGQEWSPYPHGTEYEEWD